MARGFLGFGETGFGELGFGEMGHNRAKVGDQTGDAESSTTGHLQYHQELQPVTK